MRSFGPEDFRDSHTGEDFSHATLRDVDFRGVTFRDCDFGGSTFLRCRFLGCRFTSCNFTNVILVGRLVDCYLWGCNLMGMNATRGVVLTTTFDACRMSGFNARGAVFARCTVHSRARGADFRDADLTASRFMEKDFDDALTDGANLTHTWWKGKPDDGYEMERGRTDPRDLAYKLSPHGLRFYHSSPVRFHHGDLLYGGMEGGAGTQHDNVCMTTTPVPHVTIRSRIPGWDGFYGDAPIRDWYVYEVEPLGKVTFVRDNAEYQTPSAKVIRNLGKAKALLRDDNVSVALNPIAERERMRKMQERRERRLERTDRDASVQRVVLAYLAE